MLEQYPGGRQGGVAAQVDLYRRGKPAQLEQLAVAYYIGGFRQVVLGSNLLQRGIRQPGFQWAHRGRIAAKRRGRESVYLEHFKLHADHSCPLSAARICSR
ncbi:hypothetical protein D3C75_1218250 [compost metagenome]